jgi:microcompartment protein CcmK/EutM
MQIYRITGTVTLCRAHPSFQGAPLRAAVEHGSQLLGKTSEGADMVVVWDPLGADVGSLVAVSDGAEAAQPFRPEIKPVDAYCAALLDQCSIDPRVLRSIEGDRAS